MKRASLFALLGGVLLLIALGLVMLGSTSVYLHGRMTNSYSMLWSQCGWVALGLMALAFFAFLPYRHLYRFRWEIYAFALFLLILCFVPGIGNEVNGASRWIGLKSLGIPVQFQPSELAKVALVITIAGWFARHEPFTRELKIGFLYPSLIAGGLTLAIMLEIDLGTAALCAALTACMMFVAGTRWLFLTPVAVILVSAFAMVVTMIPNRMERLLAFQNLEQYKDGLGLQQWRGLIAFGSGGSHGVGLGNSRQKMMGLPEAHTDFVFPIIGEEFGFIGSMFTVLMFLMIILAGMSIARRAPDRFSKLLAFGLTCLIALEVLINMGVTTALLPNKGLALPFVSKGGSSLLFAMVAIGMLLNIYRHGKEKTVENSPLIKRRRLSRSSHGSF